MAPALACEEVKAEDVNVTYVRDVSTNLTGVLRPTAEYITHTMATGIVLEENRECLVNTHEHPQFYKGQA